MDAFAVLAEPRRRRVVEMLAHRGKLTASQISVEFDVTPQAMSQHLKVLREANVIQMEKQAQRRLYSLNPRSMDYIQSWAAQMAGLWIGRLNRLDDALKEETA
jgi:DNA-binding transcriptional ArsR family regulator